ncbi:ParA family protein [Methylobacterium frigidaeris]|uniref:Sporulation initiation inhibitor protein Soj n=1 Tax=Methylobacterium frigidaeris TaxID=2038277 RepID=A0AA37M3W2_9HYPH|nr:ParA family protein [Methylobacterium frigidaeris]PIK71171.1 cobyrinic acid ac-diamide synthase [Methylobacterium frigidaeris]GJD61645.1 Sporulation initiation inhibitor protein Soj [Methylobacterium frigidaeris]
MTARVLSIANCKGGTGKTTSAVNLAAELGARGYRVLVVDLDPQGHAGLGLRVTARLGSPNAHTPLRRSPSSLDGAAQATEEDNVSVVPADRGFDGQLGNSDIHCFANALAPLRHVYDLVLIDVPPAAAALTVCALMASDGVVIPTTLDPLGLEGVRQFARSYHDTMLRFRAAPLGLAIAPMRIDLRTNVERETLGQLRTAFGPGQMVRGVRTDVAVSEAFARRQPVRRTRPRARAVEDFSGLADDLVQRFGIDCAAAFAEPSCGRAEGFSRGISWR